MEFQPLLGGIEFGLRFLYHAKWTAARYDFQYFLRVDDDYFVCLEKLLNELPLRPKENLVWGNFHCEINGSWVDESWMVFSRDIVETFLTQDARTMLCHPHADQQIALWLNKISDKVYFHDHRLNHWVPATFDWQAKNICDKYLGVHKHLPRGCCSWGKPAEMARKRFLQYLTSLCIATSKRLTIRCSILVQSFSTNPSLVLRIFCG